MYNLIGMYYDGTEKVLATEFASFIEAFNTAAKWAACNVANINAPNVANINAPMAYRVERTA